MMWPRAGVVAFGGMLFGVAGGTWAGDAAGLDVTIEVLGREDRIDERIVNRITVPGVAVDRRQPVAPLQGLGNAVGGTVTGVTGLVNGVVEGVVPLVPLLRYDEWVRQRRESEQSRQRESR
jgi:hypothetical protein